MKINKCDELESIRLSLYDRRYSEIEKREIYMKYLRSLRKLAYKGIPEAQYNLAAHYEDMGVLGYPNPFHNIHKKFYWYTKACENNHAAACNNLADMYERGEGCEIDVEKALFLYKKSSDLGDELGNKNYNLLKRQMKKQNEKL